MTALAYALPAVAFSSGRLLAVRAVCRIFVFRHLSILSTGPTASRGRKVAVAFLL